MLEPAGSHGVWGLDDYHCLVFVWGSSQLRSTCRFYPFSFDLSISMQGILRFIRLACTMIQCLVSTAANTCIWMVFALSEGCVYTHVTVLVFASREVQGFSHSHCKKLFACAD
jgi:hypothetical protein